MASNYSILERNVLGSLETEEAQAAFLWAAAQPGNDAMLYRAERFAREVDLLVNFLRFALAVVPRRRPARRAEIDASLMRFILDRHAFYRFPAARSSWELRHV